MIRGEKGSPGGWQKYTKWKKDERTVAASIFPEAVPDRQWLGDRRNWTPGAVVAGNVGGKERIEYTVIGDTVNMAAPLQAMSTELHRHILLHEEAHLQANPVVQLKAEKIPNVTVRDKVETVTIYAL